MSVGKQCSTLLLLTLLAPGVSALDEEAYRSEGVKRVKRDLLQDKSLKIVTILATPYAMMKPQSGSSDMQLDGYIPDMIRMLSRRLGFNYTFYLVGDGRYGSRSNTSVYGWNGMIGEVIKKDRGEEGADIAAAPMTITSSREEVVDFIQPFMHLGLSILIKKPYTEEDVQEPNHIWSIHFKILSPLSPGVWFMCIAAFALVSFVLWGMNRINPYEWGGRYNLGRASETQAESFNLSGAIWFTFTTLQWQGYERSPRSIGARVLAAFWFMFVTITMITYTGSLINYLFWSSTAQGRSPLTPPFSDLEGLLLSPDYKYGTVGGGSTFLYLTEKARGEEFDVIREFLTSEEGKDYLMPSTSRGIEKAREEKYAFIMESTTAMYESNLRPCDLMTVGEVFGQRGYGMAVPHDTEFKMKDALHTGILEMIEDGDMMALEKKWFGYGDCWNVTKKEKEIHRVNNMYLNKPTQVDISMFWGPLVILTVGIIIAILTSVAEVTYYKYKGRYDPKNRPGGQQLHLDEEPEL